MAFPQLWISFHHQTEHVDHWAVHLATEDKKDCDIWQASGQTFFFEPFHIHGMLPEESLNYKNKWLIKEGLTQAEVDIVRKIAGDHPVDNDGAYWDCRVFCFEILAELETEGVLQRSDESYRAVRKKLHEKWKSDDGIDMENSEDDADEEDLPDEEPDLTRVNDSDLEDESEYHSEDDGPVEKKVPDDGKVDGERDKQVEEPVDGQNDGVTDTNLSLAESSPKVSKKRALSCSSPGKSADGEEMASKMAKFYSKGNIIPRDR